MAQQSEIWKARAGRLVGRVFRALVVSPGVARLESQAPDVDGVTYLYVRGSRKPPAVGEFVNVRIFGVKGFDLEGEVAGRGGRA